jgi:hypothetical protein
MKKFEFSFYALSHSIDVILESENDIDEFVMDFFGLFTKEENIDYKNRKINIQSLQQNSEKLKTKVDWLIKKYKSSNIKVFQLHSYFKKLKVNEYFLIWNGTSPSRNQIYDFYNYLISIQEGKDFRILNDEFNSLFSEIIKLYDLLAVDEKTKRPIGEPDKTKRICRFCNNTRPNITFKNEAHAISEALGNKYLILNEECDDCNAEFGSSNGIENSLITFLKVYTNFFGIKGKRGIPKIKGKDFEISHESSIEIKLYSDDKNASDFSADTKELTFRLDTYDNLILQDIYRTLCKYALSIVDSKYLSSFQKTIDWINRKIDSDKLPKIAIMASYNFFKTHPGLILYLRKNGSHDLPYAVGEFHFTFITIVFIIPFSINDSSDFNDKDSFNKFWTTFKHYSLTKEWVFKNFSDKKRRNFTINYRIVKDDTKQR